jgi:GT2 family glycosyltransferase
MKSVCLAILNYNGRRHLELLLPTALEAAKHYHGDATVLVLDNRSTDDDPEWISIAYPAVKVIVAPKNDFLYSYNWLLPQLQEEIVVLLNNDLMLKEDFLLPLIEHFRNSDVFAVSSTSRDWDDADYTWGPIALNCHHGLYYWDYDRFRQEACYTLFCSGGFMAVSREKFLQIHGFNRLFYPAYGEDLDLCFRAWRRGWKCIFEPASLVFHRVHGSFNADGNKRAASLMQRCQLLFQWSTLPKQTNVLERCSMHMLKLFRSLTGRNNYFIKTTLTTLLEWLLVKKNYHHLKITKDEMNKISDAIKAPLDIQKD